jgi:D-arabinose 1-dehydrogenase-like Zn-dependent alcohol dehydrogenase
MRTMLAAKFSGALLPLVVKRVNVPSPMPGFRLVHVKACGVCGSDLSIQKGELKVPVGITLGHEIAGETEDGQRFAVHYGRGCGKCSMCRKGWVVGCENGSRRLGVNEDGGFAEYVLVSEESLVPIPAEVSFEAAAVSSDALATGLHALVDVGNLKPGETVAVFGVGGLGSAAIQIAKAVGASVIAISRSPARRALAKSLGADEVIAGSDEPGGIKQLGADLALQLVPQPAVDEQAIASVVQGGRVVLVGFTSHTFRASSLDLIMREVTIVGSRGMTKANIGTAMEWVAHGELDVSPLLSAPRKVCEINSVLDEFRAGKILRAIMQP